MKFENFLYIGIIFLLAYYIYVTNQPKMWKCETIGNQYQNCVVTNYLGK